MPRVVALNLTSSIRSSVPTCVLDEQVLYAVPVRRSLDIPGSIYKLGEVLSHSSVVLITEHYKVIVEFMDTNLVHISLCPNFSFTENTFRQKKYIFTKYEGEPQVPNRCITIREFAEAMVEFVKDKKFNTFTHNCHHARYYTMLKFGMLSANPDSGPRNLFYQGFFDFFS